MITISGRTRMTFELPVALQTAFDFYRDLNRILPYLPRIRFVQAHGEQHLRVCYVSRELNVYDVAIYCDVQAEVDPDNYTIRLAPRQAGPPVKANASFRATSAYGRYTSTSIFYPDGKQSRLEYHLELAAELPKPWAAGFVPDTVMSAIASSITDRRIQEIANGFIARSVAAIPAWANKTDNR